jgi:hypothetical protein
MVCNERKDVLSSLWNMRERAKERARERARERERERERQNEFGLCFAEYRRRQRDAVSSVTIYLAK